MSSDHQLAVDIVRNNTTPPLTPTIWRFDLLGKLARAGVDKQRADQVIDDCCREDTMQGQQLVAMEREDRTHLCLAEQERVARANQYLLGGEDEQ